MNVHHIKIVGLGHDFLLSQYGPGQMVSSEASVGSDNPMRGHPIV